MLTFDVVPFRLGAASAEAIDEAVAVFYGRIVGLATGERARLEASALEVATPVTAKRAITVPSSLRESLTDAFAAISTTTDVVVLDLSGPSLKTPPPVDNIRGAVYPHLAAAIDTTLNLWRKQQRQSRLVVLLPEVPPPRDVVREALEPHVVEGRLVIVGFDGQAIGADRAFSGPVLTAALQGVRRNALELLRAKLIVRRGWFARDDSTQSDEEIGGFVRHYFDGRYCARELEELLGTYITELPESPDLVVYDSPVSDWLQEPLRAASANLGVHCLARDAFRDAGTRGIDLDQLTRVVAIVPMAESGASVLSLRSEVFENTSAEDVRCLAILSTAGRADGPGSRDVSSGDEVVSVDYILRVRQEHVRSDSPACDVAQLGIPVSEARREQGRELTSYEFWDLVSKCGVRPERDVPQWRPAVGYTPDFPAVLDSYGSWLSSKLWELARLDVRSLPQDTLFVSPAGEEGSAKLAYFLEVAVGGHVVQVPRPIIDDLVDHPDLSLTDVRTVYGSSSSDWATELRSAMSTVVLFDEFVASGRSLLALSRVVQAFSLTVSSVICLADFAPDEERFLIPVRALYRWQRPSEDD